MQRHLKQSIQPMSQLSVEEAAIAVDDENQAASEVADLLADTDRVHETQDIVTDVQSVIAQVPEVGSVETGLVAAVGEMAAAGTDAEPADILPSSSDIAAEGFVNNILEQIKKLWKTIMEWLRKMWESIKRFFSRTAVKAKADQVKMEKIVKDEETIQKESKETIPSNSSHPTPESTPSDTSIKTTTERPAEPAPAQTTPEGMFKYQNHTLELALISSPNGKVPKDFAKEVKRYVDFSVDVFNKFADMFLDSTKHLMDVITRLNEDNAEEELKKYIDYYAQQSLAVLQKMGFDRVGDGVSESWMKEEFLGDLQVQVTSFGFSEEESPLSTKLIRLRNVRFEVSTSELKGKPDALVPLLPIGMSKDIVEAMHPWITTLVGDSKYRAALNAHTTAAANIEKAMSALVNKVEQNHNKGDEDTNHFRKYVLSLNHLVQAVMARDAGLFVDLVRHVGRINDAVLAYCLESNLENAKVTRRRISKIRTMRQEELDRHMANSDPLKL